mgnify:CR=1 FL=1
MEITRGVIPTAKKVVIYGPEGIGKSTLASRFPEPVYIDTEGSTSHMDVARFPAPTSWSMLLQEVQYVKDNPASCRTLVLDTADWAEQLCVQHICATRQVKGIEDFGYGKGYTYVKEAFGQLLNLLTDVRDKGINVVVTAHAQMRKFEQPDELGAYDRWELKLSKQCAPILKEWADMVLFCNYKTMVVNVDGQGAKKGKNKAQGGRRVMYTSHHPCWDAKNRFGLPEEAEMDYSVIRPVIEGGGASAPAPVPQPAPAPTPAPDPAPTYQMRENQQIDMVDYGHIQAGEKVETTKAPASMTAPPADEDPGQKAKSASEKKERKAEDLVSMFLSDPDKLPKNLKDLMNNDTIGEWEIQQAVYAKGYYPADTLIQDMDPEFVNGWIIGFWPKVKELIQQIRDNQAVPFN